MEMSEPRRSHWARTQQLTAGLTLLWFGVTFFGIYFARQLNFTLFGWPFSFWLAAQGALIVYLGIVGLYALIMDRLDRRLQPPDGD
jgi:putative solute:sodium symporter small subunit